MKDALILDMIKSYMKAEIENQFETNENFIFLKLESGSKIEITIKNVVY